MNIELIEEQINEVVREELQTSIINLFEYPEENENRDEMIKAFLITLNYYSVWCDYEKFLETLKSEYDFDGSSVCSGS